MKFHASFGTAENLVLHLVEEIDFVYPTTVSPNEDTSVDIDIYFDGEQVVVDIGDLVPHGYRIPATLVALAINATYSSPDSENFVELAKECYDTILRKAEAVLLPRQHNGLGRYRGLIEAWAEAVDDGHLHAICRISPDELVEDDYGTARPFLMPKIKPN